MKSIVMHRPFTIQKFKSRKVDLDMPHNVLYKGGGMSFGACWSNSQPSVMDNNDNRAYARDAISFETRG